MFEVQPVERTNSVESQLLVNMPFLQDKVSASYESGQKTGEAQCIVFSDTVSRKASIQALIQNWRREQKSK